MANPALAQLSAPERSTAAQDSLQTRELYYFSLYRVLLAVLLAGLAFSPWALDLVELRSPMLVQSVAAIYLLTTSALFLLRRRWPLTRLVVLGAVFDLIAAAAALHGLPDFALTVVVVSVLTVAGAAVLLPLTAGLTIAAAAGLVVLLETLLARFGDPTLTRSLPQVLVLAAVYLAAARGASWLAAQQRSAQALADRRGLDLANLAQLNELIVQRMRTGVLVIDEMNLVRSMNESAWVMLGQPVREGLPALRRVNAALAQRLSQWREQQRNTSEPLKPGDELPELIVSFARLDARDGRITLAFLDDTSLLNRRAEQLTLASLGRLSASIAHEIRNPLAAISYAAQLLAESEDLSEADQRLVEIVRNHCSRVNGIVENVLQLSRRERSRPEALDLAAWVQDFVADYLATHEVGEDQLRAVVRQQSVLALVDPQQLQQVVWNLVQNGLTHGRLPGQPAQVAVVVHRSGTPPLPIIDVIDRGPGIPPKVAAQIFEPFFTTSEYGNGLGLYLARQLCEANSATLSYVPLAAGGSCFRIMLNPSRLA